ncbi:MAG: succinate dehydrogenase assembly factor 2 [Hyphomicrobiaceae bacterium]
MQKQDMTDDVVTRRRRALYRAMHRGTKEMDHLVGRYADVHLGDMTGDELAEFERFLALPDPLLQGWFFSAEQVGSPEFEGLVRKMRRFHGLEDRS